MKISFEMLTCLYYFLVLIEPMGREHRCIFTDCLLSLTKIAVVIFQVVGKV